MDYGRRCAQFLEPGNCCGLGGGGLLARPLAFDEVDAVRANHDTVGFANGAPCSVGCAAVEAEPALNFAKSYDLFVKLAFSKERIGPAFPVCAFNATRPIRKLSTSNTVVVLKNSLRGPVGERVHGIAWSSSPLADASSFILFAAPMPQLVVRRVERRDWFVFLESRQGVH